MTSCRLPDSVSDEEGAVVEPLAVAVHACRRAEVWAGSKVLVSGSGPIGLLCVSVAKALGATSIMSTGEESALILCPLVLQWLTGELCSISSSLLTV